ncbi:putative transcriptional regulator [Bdellovibrio bacteriovorus str. Tiberius]|uniref:Putative transcriptional regulator n=2 Tax=Bdellovibrio bacteriovorus TaxID=959 RepID=K7YRP0_BDEBC|nr:putative transcriptional regulator [Bdellovibrio bacteriovorus str. Tiberius]
MKSLGVVKAERGDIRAERLEGRVKPAVPFPHRHDFFQVVVVAGGRGQHESDFETYPIKAGAVFVVKPGQVHRWDLQGAKGYVIEFYVESLSLDAMDRELFQSLHELPEHLKLSSAAQQKEFYFHCEKMCGEFVSRDRGYGSALKSHLNILILSLFRLSGRTAVKKSEGAFLGDFERLIELNFNRQHNVEFYAKALGLSPKALTMRVHRLLGKSAREMIHDRCLLEAQRYLGYTSMPVAEVGLTLGFQDPNYFSRFFKAKTGFSPGAFRDKNN